MGTGCLLHMTHDTLCTLQVIAETPWSQNSSRKTTDLKLLGTRDCHNFYFFFPAEHLFPAEEQSSLHSFLAPPFASSFQKCKVPALRPCWPWGSEPALLWGRGLGEEPLCEAPLEFLGFPSKPELRREPPSRNPNAPARPAQLPWDEQSPPGSCAGITGRVPQQRLGKRRVKDTQEYPWLVPRITLLCPQSSAKRRNFALTCFWGLQSGRLQILPRGRVEPDFSNKNKLEGKFPRKHERLWKVLVCVENFCPIFPEKPNA